MAESVVKLRLDSNEYDSKIKRAAQNVLEFGQNCQKAGQSVAKADKETLDYVQAIGKMETVSKTAKGKINEMTSAFTELSVQYKQLTDEEKKSPYGQALSQSLDQLKGRINESKAQLSEINSELGNTSAKGEETGSVLNELAGKFGLNITQAGAFGMALGAATTAAKVAKDAFFSNEQQLDEWGRVVVSSESVYRGFLDALNTGDISGFLGRISSIVSAARDAYDALDELATFNAFNQVNVARTRQQLMNAQNDYREGTGSKEQVRTAAGAYKAELDQRIQFEKNAYSKAITDYAKRRGVNPVDLARVMLGSYGDYNKLKAMPLTGSRTTIKTNMYGQQWTQTTRVAANEKERMGEMLRRFNDTELQELQGLGARFFQTGFEKGQIDRQVNRILNGRQGGAGGGRTGGTSGGLTGGKGGGGRGGGGTIAAPPPVGSIAEQEAKVQALTKAWREASDQAGRDGYLAQLNEAKAVLEQMQGKTKVEEIIPEGSLKDLNNQMQELQKQRELLADPIDISILDDDIQRIKGKIDELNGVVKKDTTSTPMSLEDKIRISVSDSITALDETTLTNLMEFKIRNGLENLDIKSDYLQQAIFGDRINIPDDYWIQLEKEINTQLAALNIAPIKIDVNTGEITKQAKSLNKDWMAAASAIQSVGSAMQSIEDPAMKVIGTIAQAIASIALGAGQAIEAKSRETGNKWEWIAFAASATATMISTIAAVKSNTKGFEQGGIVPGNRWSGDNLSTADYGINSGELILSRAQQGVIARELQANNSGSEMQPYLDVEKIWLGLSHYTKRTGKGEIITSR